MSVPAVGTLAPDFSLPDLSGAAVSLRGLASEGPVLLFFFKADCGACQLAAPMLEGIRAGYEGHVSAEGTSLQVVGVSQDDGETTDRFRQEHGLKSALLVDGPGLSASRLYDLEATPTLLLLLGAERLRSDAGTVAPDRALRVLDLVEGWSRDAYVLVSEEIAARVGALPADLASVPVTPGFRPG